MIVRAPGTTYQVHGSASTLYCCAAAQSIHKRLCSSCGACVRTYRCSCACWSTLLEELCYEIIICLSLLFSWKLSKQTRSRTDHSRCQVPYHEPGTVVPGTVSFAIAHRLLYMNTSLTRVTKSYLPALGTTQISSSFTKHWTKFLTHQTGNYPVTCFVSKPSRITLVELSIINTSYQKLPFMNTCGTQQ